MSSPTLDQLLTAPSSPASSAKNPAGVFLPAAESVLSFINSLYDKYAGELGELSKLLSVKFKEMRQKGFSAGFGDFEGEMLYMLIREYRPQLIYEISPDTGYSANYILSAVNKNGSGRVESFEICPSFQGIPTLDVIKGNQIALSDLSRYHLNLGDAIKIVPERLKTEVPDFVLIDSCHDDYFARFYIEQIFPKARGHIFIQDICWFDPKPEFAHEALVLLDFLQTHKINFIPITIYEDAVANKRAPLSPRRAIRSNSILLKGGASLQKKWDYYGDYAGLIQDRTGFRRLLDGKRWSEQPPTFLQLTALANNSGVRRIPPELVAQLTAHFSGYDLWCQYLILELFVRVKRTDLFNRFLAEYPVEATKGCEIPTRLARLCRTAGKLSEAKKMAELAQERGKDAAIPARVRNLLNILLVSLETGASTNGPLNELKQQAGLFTANDKFMVVFFALCHPSVLKYLPQLPFKTDAAAWRKAFAKLPWGLTRALLKKAGFPILSLTDLP